MRITRNSAGVVIGRVVLGSAGTLLVLMCLGGIVSPETTRAVAADEETPKEIIAIQIRRQGYSCDKPQTATRDPEHTKPDEVAWILACDDARYRVVLRPDMAALVERLQ